MTKKKNIKRTVVVATGALLLCITAVITVFTPKSYENVKIYDKDGVLFCTLNKNENEVNITGRRVLEQAKQDLKENKIYRSEINIYSTVSSEVQKSLDEVIVNSEVPDFFQIAMQVTDYEGRVLGVAGGIGKDNTLNRATEYHSVGSSIKPVATYLPAIESNLITFSSVNEDKPLYFDSDGAGWPANADKIYAGQILTAAALRQSKNTIAVALADKQGTGFLLDRLINKFRFTGLTPMDNTTLGVGLGYLKTGVTLEELAAAYQVFGNGGTLYEPVYYTKITDKNGTVVFEKEAVSEIVSDPESTGIINRILIGSVTEPDGLAHGAKLPGTEVFGKTGTTDNLDGIINNTVFAGGTPDMLGVVWIGNDDKDFGRFKGVMPKTTEVWHAVMESIPQTTAEFCISPGLIKKDFCTETGLAATPACPEKMTGYYKDGTVPPLCDVH
ncbi:hypothetical protein FACS1894120_5250 [Clostridia bacterium]|nr:hypothetical protein FACS1894120_5250 [Clostridia bacterium]